jgi:hypothetical protein
MCLSGAKHYRRGGSASLKNGKTLKKAEKPFDFFLNAVNCVLESLSWPSGIRFRAHYIGYFSKR